MTRGLLRVSSVCTTALLLLLTSTSWSAVTGKLAGTVADSETGGPLVGAAVSLVGTNIGSTTDSDGRYFIINVPPGEYVVQSAMIGYQAVNTQGVIVNIDRTVNVDFSLAESAIAVEAIVVTAQRELIKLDVSGSTTILDAVDILAVPRKSVQEALALQPGVGVEGEIRGGSLDQTQIIVDGRLSVDERLNRPVMTVSTSALEEVQVLTGGFNAEYGNARSGVINIVTRSAINRPIWTTMEAQYYPAHTKFREPDGDAYGAGSLEWRTYGNDNTSTVLVGTKLDPEDASKTLPDTIHAGWDAIAASAQNPLGLSAADLRNKWRHQHPAWDYGDEADYVVDGAVGVPIGSDYGIVMSARREFTPYAIPQSISAYTENLFTIKVNARPAEALGVNVSATFGNIEGVGSAQPGGTPVGGARPGVQREGLSTRIFRDFGPDIQLLNPVLKYAQYYYPNAENTQFGMNVNATYALSNNQVIEAGMDITDIEYDVRSSATHVSTNAGEPGVVIYNGTAGSDTVNSLPTGWLGDSSPDGTGLGYELAGDNSALDSSNFQSVRLYGSFTNQIGTRNLVKIGVEGVFTTINQFGGHRTPKDVVINEFTAEPTRLAAYVQDKIEYEGMVANIGLRLDVYNSNGQTIEPNEPFSNVFDENEWGNRLDPKDWDPANSLIARFGPYGSANDPITGASLADSIDVEDASQKVQISPRLGISHPISDKTKIYFNYGHFYTAPKVQWVYGYRYNQPGSISETGNPDLEMPRTISYELGVDHELMSEYLIRGSIYYKDATDEIRYLGYTSAGPQKYTRDIPYNKQYSDIRGFEVSVSKRIGKFVTGFLNGGNQTVTTTYLGDTEVFSQDPAEGFAGNKPVEETQPQSNRARPYGKLNIDLHTPSDYEAFGLPAMATGGWSLSWLTEYQRGNDVIYDPLGDYVKSPNVSNQDWWMSDMRITKNLSVANTDVAIYLDVLNVLDRKVWNGSMRADDMKEYLRSLHFDIDDPLVEETKGSDKIGDTPDYAKLPDRDQWALYKYPRTIALGLRVNF